MLTNEEKISIVAQHIKNIEVNQYNLQLTLSELNAKSTPDSDAVASVSSQMDDLAAQKIVLNTELSSLQEA